MNNPSLTQQSASVADEYNASRSCIDKGTLCHAPETSMYFGRDGMVSACCYSRSSPLGSYPSQTITEIWNGARANDMRASLRKNILPGGCELCADKLMARNFSQLMAPTYDSLASLPVPKTALHRIKHRLFRKEVERWPLQMEFELSNKCNLACAMCSGFFSSTIRTTREKLPPLAEVYDDTFIEQLKPFLQHLRRARFLGGEPFLIEIYYKIWDALMEVNPACEISITTNGTVFNGKVEGVLERLNCHVIISLDSIHKPTYEQIRVNAMLEKTLENVDSITEINRRKNKPVVIAVCPMQSNWREIPDLIKFANARGARVVFNMVVFPLEHSIQSLPRETKKEIADYFRSACGSSTNELVLQNFKSLLDLSKQVDHWARPALAQSPIQKRCLKLLEEFRRTETASDEAKSQQHWLKAALTDLAAPEDFTELNSISDGDVKLALHHYLQSIWWIGRKLEEEGVTINARYRNEDLCKFLTFIEQNVDITSAQRMLKEFRRFTETLLEMCGTRTAEQMIQINKEFFGLQVKSMPDR